MELRVGQGVDVHAFSPDPGRPLRLGGVPIPDGPGLAGHSDADVLLHALTDAVLGAAGLGDLGALVGTDDPAVAGAASAGFLAEALRGALAAGWAVANADVTIIGERPRIGPHREAIATEAARLLGAPVNVKATTTDGLGVLGRGEGLACVAVVLLVRR